MPSRRTTALRSVLAVVAVISPIAALTVPGTFASAAGPIYSPLDRYGNGETAQTFQGPVPEADCGKGSKPEVDIQGRVPVSERTSGASSAGYWCNLDLIGNYGPDDPNGFEGAEWQLARYKNCAYYSQRLVGGAYPNFAGVTQPGSADYLAEYASGLGPQKRPGTVVVDVSDPTDPKYATNIFTAGMGDPWETLKVHAERGLLAATNVLDGQGGSFMGIYDISQDCTNPVKLFDGPITAINHEGNFSADGMTYYTGGLDPGIISAIDVSDPRNPELITTFFSKKGQHGMSTSRDGNLLFLSHINEDWPKVFVEAATRPLPSALGGNGMGIYDISEIQSRKANPQVRLVNALEWSDGQLGQHTLNFSKGGKDYAIEVSESGHGAARIIDISDLKDLKVVSKLKTAIMMPENAGLAEEDLYRPPFEIAGIIPFGYNFHYCNLDTLVNPTMLACSAFQQGLRVFDIRNLSKPKEIAYYNPGGDGTLQAGSWGGTYSGFPAAMPQFVPERKELWFTDQDRGLFVLRFTNGSWISKVKSSKAISHGN
ncbi:MAG: LVIVD repeat-containing protein [Sporichthyaceae bacterium]